MPNRIRDESAGESQGGSQVGREMIRPRGAVGAVAGAVDVLWALGRAGGQPQGVRDIAHLTGLPPSTVHRLLASLTVQGMVEHVPRDQRYALGPRLWELLAQVVREFDWRRVLQERLDAIAAETRETVHLTIAVGKSVMDIDVRDSPETVGVRRVVGELLPVHATAVGKVFLTFSLPFRSALSNGQLSLPRLTPLTRTDPAELQQELEEVRRQGYAINLGERSELTAGAAVPIFDLPGTLVAAVGVSGPRLRLATVDQLHALGQYLQKMTRPFSNLPTA